MKIKIPQEKFIVNQRYRKLCDIAYSYSYYENGHANIYRISPDELVARIRHFPHRVVSVYSRMDDVLSLFGAIRNINKEIIVFTGCSDTSIGEKQFKSRPPNIVKWFGENIDTSHDDLIPTPIGSLVGSWIGNDPVDKCLVGHKDYVAILTNNEEKKEKDGALMAFSLNTNYGKRNKIYEYLKGKSYVTDACSTNAANRALSEREFCQEIYDHKFVISPPGNGIDCGRTWVSLQLGTIPIVESSILIEHFRGLLPIFIYKDVTDITEENLFEFAKGIKSSYRYDIMNIDYYRDYVDKIKMATL